MMLRVCVALFAVAIGSRSVKRQRSSTAEDLSTFSSTGCGSQWDNIACAWKNGQEECHSCGDRITYLRSIGYSEQDAKQQVASEFPSECGECGTCWAQLSGLATDEGNELGEFSSGADGPCKGACGGNAACNSFSFCPQWGKCWLKDRSFSGDEPTTNNGCTTYYKTSCGGSPSPVPSPTPSGGGSFYLRVVSYNLYWWNAFQQNPWKSDGIVANIANTLRADTLGMQECNEPWTIQSRAGYSPASAFADSQGVSVKPGFFNVGQTGSRDIGAEGRWGPRHVTWAELTHIATGRTFWHFNTHWCVHWCDQNKRYGGAVNMMNTIREKAGSLPVVVTGDFNVHNGMHEPGIEHLLQNGFTKAVDHWVDAVFYTTAHWNRVSTSVGDAAGSDHRPVIADLQLK